MSVHTFPQETRPHFTASEARAVIEWAERRKQRYEEQPHETWNATQLRANIARTVSLRMDALAVLDELAGEEGFEDAHETLQAEMDAWEDVSLLRAVEGARLAMLDSGLRRFHRSAGL